MQSCHVYCFASASLLMISLLFFVTTPSSLGSGEPKEGFFLADCEIGICFSFVFFTIFPAVVVVVAVFFGLVREAGLSTWKRREVQTLRLKPVCKPTGQTFRLYYQHAIHTVFILLIMTGERHHMAEVTFAFGG